MEKRKKLAWLNLAFWLITLWILLSVAALIWAQKTKEENIGISAIEQTPTGNYFLVAGATLYILDSQENISFYSPLETFGITGMVTDMAAISDNRVIIGDSNEGTLKLCAPWIAQCEYFLSKNGKDKHLYRSDFSFTINPMAQRLYVREAASRKIDTYTLSGSFLGSTYKQEKGFSINKLLMTLDRVLPLMSQPSSSKTSLLLAANSLKNKLVGDTQLLNAPIKWPVMAYKTDNGYFWVKGNPQRIMQRVRQQSNNEHSGTSTSSLLNVKALNTNLVLFEKGKYSILSVDYNGRILGSFGGTDIKETLSQLEGSHASARTLTHFIQMETLISSLAMLVFWHLRNRQRKLVIRDWAQNLIGNDLGIRQTGVSTPDKKEPEPELPDILWIKPVSRFHSNTEKLFIFLKGCIFASVGTSLFSGYSQTGLDIANLLIMMAGLLLITQLAQYYFITQTKISGAIGTDGHNLWLRDYKGKTVMAHPDDVIFTDRAISARGITVVISDNGEHGGKSQIFPMEKLMRHIYPLLNTANKVSSFKMGLSMLLSRHPKVWPPVMATLSGLTALLFISFAKSAVVFI